MIALKHSCVRAGTVQTTVLVFGRWRARGCHWGKGEALAHISIPQTSHVAAPTRIFSMLASSATGLVYRYCTVLEVVVTGASILARIVIVIGFLRKRLGNWLEAESKNDIAVSGDPYTADSLQSQKIK